MIEARNITMRFDKTEALSHLHCEIPEGCIYGLVGSNGAGKSTLLRLLSGVYKPNEGEIRIDGQPVWDHPETKEKTFFAADEIFFLPQSNMDRMAKFYQSAYHRFSAERYRKLVELFKLDPKAPLTTFSKGMRRQAATILALSCRAKYSFFDETFDGLDPVIRDLVRRILYEDVQDNGSSYVLTSHSLRELEDTCDQLALLHKGGVVFEKDVQELSGTLFKIQAAFAESFDKTRFASFELLSYRQQGSVANLILRGEKEAILTRLRAMHPLLLELLPLTLEEVFLYEMEALGYAFPELSEGAKKE